jgi:Na+-transporting methylmalonyl-CoA/oxaloacetate decarboxylase gamma subunit
MLKAANRAALRLWKEESGVVLAVTVIIFLTLFLMACSVYAIGETVRQRVELQNGADAGAYSAAIVQADALSRVAAINRAMSWTYVQMVRMEMDYIVDKWLKLTLERWDKDNDDMRNYNLQGTCNIGLPFYATGKGFVHKMILLNKTQLVSKDQIEAARQSAAAQGKSYSALAPKIDRCRTQIKAMNAKEKKLIQELPDKVKKTVKRVLKENAKDTWNDSFAGGGKIAYALKQEEKPLDKNFRVLEQKEEEDFLRHSDYIPEDGSTAKEVFGNGTDTWFVKQYKAGGPGLQRQYKRGHPILVAEWDWISTKWKLTKAGCIPNGMKQGFGPQKGPVKGDDDEIYDEDYYITELAQPQVLQETFFAKGGSIVVGLTRQLNNPFQFMAVGNDTGIMTPFTVNGGKRKMWTVSAALAGYNKKPREEAEGKYEVTYENNEKDKLWNLKTSDWDAELLPLHRAWAKGKDRSWQGDTAGQILNTMKSEQWTPLYNGGGDLGAQGAPKGMNEGSEVSYGGAEGWVVH